ncbi:iron ABC transporter permease [Rhizobium sp. P32RR-XVIII]|uniref:ABC transporter permease n=1 Tax=Rhizobium sp. P32RR-XVIII TaxID=2726738 RepID=UPI0014567656|nr:iron ABC transporter permease [Rhizobium sp. P32RR-XVIII]NLS06075.1 iron ABC transporter permease [Rhizobium sp. P32RR-XVIII]
MISEFGHTPALPGYLRYRGVGRDQLIQYAVLVVTAFLVLSPIVPILYQSLLDKPLYDSDAAFTTANFSRLLGDATFRDTLINTFVVAVSATIIAQLIGLFAAILVSRTDLPTRSLLGSVILWPMYISGLVLAFGFVLVYGPAGFLTQLSQTKLGFVPWNLYSIQGISLVTGITQAPLTMLYCLNAADSIDATLENAARSCGARPLRTLIHITVPLMLPAFLYSAVLNFTLSLETLSVPLILGEPVGIRLISTFLFEKMQTVGQPDYAIVSVAACLLLVLVALLVLLQGVLLRNSKRFVTISGKASRQRIISLGWVKWVAAVIVWAYLVSAILLPIGFLVIRASVSYLSPAIPLYKALTLGNLRELFSVPVYIRAIVNTFIISIVGGAIATAFVTLAALVAHRSDFRYQAALNYLAMVPRAIPGIIASLGFFYALVILPSGGLRNTIWVLVIAYTMRNIPLGFGAISPMLLQASPDLDRCARTVGADWWTSCRFVLAGVIRPAILSCYALMFITFFKEYATAIFLYASGSEVIGTMLLSLYGNGRVGPVAALCCLQIAVVATLMLVLKARMRRDVVA